MNVFKGIIDGEIPCDKILEDDEFLSFYDINPKAKIHVLVVPKEEILDFEEVSPEKMKSMTAFIKKVTSKLGVDKTGYRMITNIGADGRQEVPHLHFHIIGGERLSN